MISSKIGRNEKSTNEVLPNSYLSYEIFTKNDDDIKMGLDTKTIGNQNQSELKPLGTKTIASKSSLEEIEPSGGDKVDDFLESALKKIGKGRWEWLMFFILSYPCFILAFGNFGGVFLSAIPEYRCNDEKLRSSKSVHDNSSECIFYYNEDNSSDTSMYKEVKCTQWIYDTEFYGPTIITEWDLICDQLWKKSTAQALYMLGVLIGGFFLSELSDMYGRKKILLISNILTVVASGIVCVTESYVSFVIIRFISAFFLTGIFLPSFVLLMEIIHPDSRTYMGLMYQMTFSVGTMLLPGIAYLVKNWRYLQGIFTIIFGLMLVGTCFIPESPRWMIGKGSIKEAIVALENIAKKNAKTEYISLLHNFENHKPKEKGDVDSSLSKKIISFFTNIKDLVNTPVIRRRSLILCYLYFAVAITFYGLAMADASLNTTPYVLLLVGGAGDIIGLLLATIFMPRFGRKWTLSASYFLCGIACILIIIIPMKHGWLVIAFSTIGKLFNAAAFGVVFAINAELMPTPMRNCSLGVSTMFSRIGGAIVPYIVDLLALIHPYIPLVIFSITSLVAGLLTMLLPETSNKPLPETIDEVEKAGK